MVYIFKMQERNRLEEPHGKGSMDLEATKLRLMPHLGILELFLGKELVQHLEHQGEILVTILMTPDEDEVKDKEVLVFRVFLEPLVEVEAHLVAHLGAEAREVQADLDRIHRTHRMEVVSRLILLGVEAFHPMGREVVDLLLEAVLLVVDPQMGMATINPMDSSALEEFKILRPCLRCKS